MIRYATASVAMVNLLGPNKQTKPKLTARLNRENQISLEKLKNVRFIKPVVLVQIHAQTGEVERVVIGQFSYWRDQVCIRHEYVIAPIASQVSFSPTGDFDLNPYKDAQRLVGDWMISLKVADFTKSVLENSADKFAILKALPYVSVSDGDIQWRVTGEASINDLDMTGQFRSRQAAEDVILSDAEYGLGEI